MNARRQIKETNQIDVKKAVEERTYDVNVELSNRPPLWERTCLLSSADSHYALGFNICCRTLLHAAESEIDVHLHVGHSFVNYCSNTADVVCNRCDLDAHCHRQLSHEPLASGASTSGRFDEVLTQVQCSLRWVGKRDETCILCHVCIRSSTTEDNSPLCYNCGSLILLQV